MSCEYLEHCFWESQDLLMQEQQNQGRMNEMKTTLVVLLVDENKVIWGHIGDSRLYYFKQKRLQERTLDHSVPQMLVASGEITEKEIRGHADRNRLLRVMGTEWESPRYQIAQPMEREGQQEFLLCTDGFWELIEERHMSHMLKKSKTPEAWLTSMEQLVLKHGKDKEMDNYSAIAVFLEQ